jgi:hypothetical protein
VDALAYGFIFEITPELEDLTSMREIYRNNFKGAPWQRSWRTRFTGGLKAEKDKKKTPSPNFILFFKD